MKGKEKTLKEVKKVADYNLESQDLTCKNNLKGVTLVALVVTIMVLLILAGITITALLGDNGIIAKAKGAKQKTETGVQNEKEEINDLIDEFDSIYNNNSGDGTGEDTENDETKITAEKLNTVLNATANTKLTDKYGNKITVPAGFKILVDGTTGYTAETVDVTKGIVIEDVSAKDASTQGSQFVWIPVGKIYTDTAKTDNLAKTITLGRYENFTADDSGNYTPVVADTAINTYYKELATSTYENETARSITDFIASANNNGGYYLGRFEASLSGATIACKAGQAINDTVQTIASDKSKAMYENGYATGTYSSDLVNSYAWDTAIAFVQTFEEANFANLTKTDVGCMEKANSGSNNNDKFCNIYDMVANVSEWTTETYDSRSVSSIIKIKKILDVLISSANFSRVFAAAPDIVDEAAVYRGGNSEEESFCTADRHKGAARGSGFIYGIEGGYRPLLYVN